MDIFFSSGNNAQLGVTGKLISTGGMHTKYALDFRILNRAHSNEAYTRAQDVHNPPSVDDFFSRSRRGSVTAKVINPVVDVDDGFSRSRRGSVTAKVISPVVDYVDVKLPADVDLLSAGIGLIIKEDESRRKIVEQVIFFRT
jgi:hypothetical protein